MCQHDRAKLIAAGQFSQQNLRLAKRSVLEVASACEGHRHASLVGGGDDFLVALGAARLYRRGRACLGGGDEAVGEREEGIAAYDAAVEVESGLACLPNGDATGVDSAHLADADAEGAILGDVNNGVGLDVLDGTPTEEHGLEFVLAWVALCDDFKIGGGSFFEVALLHEERLGTH